MCSYVNILSIANWILNYISSHDTLAFPHVPRKSHSCFPNPYQTSSSKHRRERGFWKLERFSVSSFQRNFISLLSTFHSTRKSISSHKKLITLLNDSCVMKYSENFHFEGKDSLCAFWAFDLEACSWLWLKSRWWK